MILFCKSRRIIAFWLLFGNLGTGRAAHPYAGWNYRLPITVTGYTENTTLTNFPLLVTFGEHIPNFSYSDFQFPNGGDLRFADATDTIPLPFEIESWNTSGVSLIWVRVPELAGTNTQFFAYWGGPNTNMPTDSPWDSGYIGVWHLRETNALDSTTNAFHGTAAGPVQAISTGKINGAISTTTNNHIAVPDQNIFTLGSNYTVSAWIRSAPVGNVYEGIFGTYTGGPNGFIVGLNNDANNTFRFWSGNVWKSSGIAIPDNVWKHVAYTYDGTNGRFYVDGVLVNTAAGHPVQDGGDLHLGSGGTGWLQYRYAGLLDEVRISSFPRGSNWIWACWRNQNEPGTFLSFGSVGSAQDSLAIGSFPPLSLTHTSAVFQARLMGTGGSPDATVTFCWGAADGGTNSLFDWDFQAPKGDFACFDWIQHFQDGLVSGSTYCYRAFASNDTGVAWSEAQWFTNLYKASIVNQGAVGTRRNNARLGGEITDWGWDAPPSITLYFWQENATSTSVIPAGIQSGAFLVDVTNLVPATPYGFFFTASNSVGISTSSTAFFTTLSENPVFWYVSTNGANTAGTNWSTAFSSIHDAWPNLLPGDTVYLAGHLLPVTNTLRWPGANLSLIGGFQGLSGEPGPRNPTQWPTILERTGTDNYRIIELSFATNALLDGLTIRNGFLAGTIYGAGLHISNSVNVTMLNCVIESNRLTHTAANQTPAGAGLYALNTTLTMSNCLVRWNQTYGGVLNYSGSGHGAGLYVQGGTLTLVDSLVVSNRGEFNGNSRSSGAGLYLNGGTHTIRRTYFLFNYANGHGGGIYMTGNNVALVENSSILGNYAVLGSGGVYMNGGTLRNVLIAENETLADSGGAQVANANCQLYNVTVVRNRSGAVGSIAGLNLTAGAATNVIAFFNLRTVDNNWDANISLVGGTVTHTCSKPIRSGTGNTAADPEFTDWENGNYRLRPGSPAMNTGTILTWMAGATDLDGNPRIRNEIPDMGAYEAAGPSEGDLRANFIASPLSGHDLLPVTLTAHVHGEEAIGLTYRWDFNNDGTWDVVGSDKAIVTNVFGLGWHTVRLEVENHQAETVQVLKSNYIHVSPSEIYVWSGGNHTTGDSWSRAFTNIQTAIDECIGTNVIYLAGQVFDVQTNLIWSGQKSVRIQGGYEVTNSPSGPGPRDPIRWPTVIQRVGSLNFRVLDAAFLTDCVLDGVTIANGNTPTFSDVGHGGGMRLVSSILTINDCVFTNNVLNVTFNAYGYGGGLYSGNSTLTVARTLFILNRSRGLASSNNNRAHGGGLAVVNGALTLLNSQFLYNDADAVGHHGNQGGGLYVGGSGTFLIRNCLFAFNRAGPTPGSASSACYGGGVYLATGILENCTIASNQIANVNASVSSTGGGLYVVSGFVTNSIIYHNFNRRLNSASDVYAANFGRLFYSCAPELTNAANANITADPRFEDRDAGNFALLPGSPCVDAGINLPWMNDALDLAGKPRIRRGRVDMGAYETAPPAGTIMIIR